MEEPMRPVVTFAYVTGWRINSEVLPLQWRQVDLKAGEVRLDPGTTKNLEGRVFYLTAELKKLLIDQRKAANRVQRRKGMIVQHVFFHDGTTKAGDVAFLAGHAISGSGFYHAWCRARIKAGCPGSIPHDFRRTAIRNMVRAGVPERVHEAERPQDPQRVRPVQHRQRRRLAGRCAASRGPSEDRGTRDEEQIVSPSPRTGSSWQLDRYNGTFGRGLCCSLSNRLGTVLGTVGGSELGSSRKPLKFPSKFNAVRWPRG